MEEDTERAVAAYERDEEEKTIADYATYCPDCQGMFFEGETGFDQDECFECGASECYEVPA